MESPDVAFQRDRPLRGHNEYGVEAAILAIGTSYGGSSIHDS